MGILASLGINHVEVGGFIIACVLSWFFADAVIQHLYNKRFKEMTEQNRSITLAEVDRASLGWTERLDLAFGKRIGRIERVFYIYAL